VSSLWGKSVSGDLADFGAGGAWGALGGASVVLAGAFFGTFHAGLAASEVPGLLPDRDCSTLIGDALRWVHSGWLFGGVVVRRGREGPAVPVRLVLDAKLLVDGGEGLPLARAASSHVADVGAVLLVHGLGGVLLRSGHVSSNMSEGALGALISAHTFILVGFAERLVCLGHLECFRVDEIVALTPLGWLEPSLLVCVRFEHGSSVGRRW